MNIPATAVPVVKRANELGLACKVTPAGGAGKRAIFRFLIGNHHPVGTATGATPAMAWLEGWAAAKASMARYNVTFTSNTDE